MRKLMVMLAAFLLTWALPGLCEDAAPLIKGLEELPRISSEEAQQLPEATESVLLTLNGVQLPHDADSNTYFIPQSAASDGFEGEIVLEKRDGWTYSLCAPEGGKQKALRNSLGYMVYGVKGDECASAMVIFTSLPVLVIETDSGELPVEEDGGGMLSLFTPEGGTLWLDRTPVEINLRGNTSTWFPKNSYRLKIVDDSGEKANLSITGLRSDDDWILNPMYTDTSKLRERLAYDLWAQMNSVGTDANSSRLEYAEVFINGTYWGLYGVQERIDRKQVDASKRSGILYKVAANFRPTPDELLACEGEVCQGIELEFAGAAVKEPWLPAAAYMAALDGPAMESRVTISMENVIDYGLWAMFTQAHDCQFKNQFLNCVHDGMNYVIYKIPWDVNHTFGDVWENDAEATNYNEFRIASLIHEDGFSLLLSQKDAAVYRAIRSRWQELRRDILTKESIMTRAEALHDSLYPAIQRDSRRWPECGLGEGNTENIDDIGAFIDEMLPRMDEYIASLGA